MNYVALTILCVFLVVLFVVPMILPHQAEIIGNSNNISDVAPIIESVFTAPVRLLYDPVHDFMEILDFEGDDLGMYVGDFFTDTVDFFHKYSPIGWLYELIKEVVT